MTDDRLRSLNILEFGEASPRWFLTLYLGRLSLGFVTTLLAVPLVLSLIGFQDLVRDTQSLLFPKFQRSEIFVGTFQILWIYYGLLITSRPVVAWNVIGVIINFVSNTDELCTPSHITSDHKSN